MNQSEVKAFIIDKIEDLKGRDILILDVSKKSTVTDTMIVCSGNSKRHVISIAEHVKTEAKNASIAPLSIEGKDTGDWVLVDFGDVIVHVMQDESRDFYQLEKLWA